MPKSILAASLLALAACTTIPQPPVTIAAEAPAPLGAPAPDAERRAPVTILISIDGFRPDYLDRGITPNLNALAAGGVLGTMRPSFPTLTFPNHYAMATGLRPDRSGMVDNKMFDPGHLGAPFDIHDPATSRDSFWWNEAEPVWVTAERAGIATGMMFWPGADVAIRGVRPGNWFTYDAAVTSRQRVDAVLDWARRPAATRPNLLGLYLDIVDKTAHADGIEGQPMTDAIREIDAQVGRLVAGLAAMGQPADIVIVSDHGMAQVTPDHVMPLANLIDAGTMDVVQKGGPSIGIWPKPGQDAAVAAALLRPHPHTRCWRKADIPARWHYGANTRVPPFYCLVDIGWRYSADPAKDHGIGDHGFDNAEPAMAALFLANGPHFKAGGHVATFDNVDIAPLVRDLIGLPAGRGLDGDDRPFDNIRKR